MAIEPTNESRIRNGIVALIEGVPGVGKVYNRLRRPADGLIREFTALNVDDASQINVVFVRRVAFQDQVSSFDDHISNTEEYHIFFYRGILDAADDDDSENVLQAFIENVRVAFQENKDLGIDLIGEFLLSQGGMSTASPWIDTNQLGGIDCHRFIGRLTVSIEEC